MESEPLTEFLASGKRMAVLTDGDVSITLNVPFVDKNKAVILTDYPETMFRIVVYEVGLKPKKKDKGEIEKDFDTYVLTSLDGGNNDD